MKASIQDIKKLRELTQLSISECKEALEKAKGDLDKAISILRKKAKEISEKKSKRETKEGVVACYIHTNKKIGAMIEVLCETDFVAKNEEFQKLAYELAIQVAGYNPKFVEFESLSKKEKEKILKDLEKEIDDSKPEDIKNKILEGKLQKYIEENSLLEQQYFRDENIKIKDLINQHIHKFGENIKIEKFIRFEI